jgi:hypothetical protein
MVEFVFEREKERGELSKRLRLDERWPIASCFWWIVKLVMKSKAYLPFPYLKFEVYASQWTFCQTWFAVKTCKRRQSMQTYLFQTVKLSC